MRIYLYIIAILISVTGKGQSLTPGTISTDQNICTTCIPARLISTPPNGTLPVYQWRSASSYSGTYSDINGETNATYQPPALTATTYYLQLQNSTGTTGGPLPTNKLTLSVSQTQLIRTLQGVSISTYACYNATDTLTADGSTRTVTVQSTGGLVLIAGSNILLGPGVSIIAGGYLHGYIRTSIKAVNRITQSAISKINGVTRAAIMRVNGVNNY